jgi:phenylalanyl-tRNA synthetase beta chain
MGWFGQLHPNLAAQRKLKEAVFLGELYLDRLLQLPTRKPAVRELSRYQAVRRDFSLWVPEKTKWAEIDSALGALGIAELTDWRAREALRPTKSSGDAKAQTAEYSLLLGATFQASDRTLREEELQGFSQRIVEAVSQLGARLRT